MIRIIIYLALYIFGITMSFGQITSEEVLIQNDSIQLPGTLTFSAEKTPLIIWVHGSGNVDRNGNQGAVVKANYIKQFRDEINKNNIAFYSFDKRTSNPKNAKYLKGIVFEDFISDVNKVIVHFKTDERFSEIILVGHSQGSLIAMLASKNVTKYVSLAGPSISIDKTIVNQISNQNEALGKTAKDHFKELKETGGIKNVNPFLISVFAKQNLAFMNSWLQYNPTEEIKKLTLPVLIINGTKDLQVKVKDANALHSAKSTSELVLIENMNHVLKNIEVDEDNLKSYYSAEYPIAKELIKTIVRFVKK